MLIHIRIVFCIVERTAYPDSGLSEVGPHGYLLSGAHVRVPVPLKGGLELLQLLAREVSSLSPRFLFLGVVRVSVITSLFNAPLLFCERQTES